METIFDIILLLNSTTMRLQRKKQILQYFQNISKTILLFSKSLLLTLHTLKSIFTSINPDIPFKNNHINKYDRY